jgi:hypothetical protein
MEARSPRFAPRTWSRARVVQTRDHLSTVCVRRGLQPSQGQPRAPPTSSCIPCLCRLPSLQQRYQGCSLCRVACCLSRLVRAVVTMMSRYSDGLDGRGVGVRVPIMGRVFRSPHRLDRYFFMTWCFVKHKDSFTRCWI